MCKPHSSNHFLLSECCSKIIGLFNDNTIMKRVRNCSIFMLGGIEEFSGRWQYLSRKRGIQSVFPQYWRAKHETYVYKKKKKKTGFKRGHKHFCPKCRKMQNVYAKIYENNTFSLSQGKYWQVPKTRMWGSEITMSSVLILALCQMSISLFYSVLSCRQITHIQTDNWFRFTFSVYIKLCI